MGFGKGGDNAMPIVASASMHMGVAMRAGINSWSAE